MIKSRKQMYLVIGIFALILFLGGTTYAFFNYTRTGVANVIKTGRITFNSSQGNAINLTNLFPIDVSGGIPNDNTKVGTVTINISGDTTYSEGIEYLVSAVNVENTVGSGQSAKSLPISIDVAVASSTENTPATTLGTASEDYFTDRGSNASIYKVLASDVIKNNKELVVGYIAPGQTGVDGNIVIRAYLDASKIAISDTYPEGDVTHTEGEEPNQTTVTDYTNGTTSTWVGNRTVFTTTEWNSLQANGVSFQVKVEANEGIWVEEPEPDDVTPEVCFGKELVNIYSLNPNMTQTELNDCISYVNSLNITFENNDTAENYCRGTARETHEYNFQSKINEKNIGVHSGYELDIPYLLRHNIITKELGIKIKNYNTECGGDIVIPRTMNYTRQLHNSNMSQVALNNCIDYVTNELDMDFDTENGENAENFCNGTGTRWGWSFQDYIDENDFSSQELTYLLNNQIIIDDEARQYNVLLFPRSYELFGNNNSIEVTKLVFNNNLKFIGNYALDGVRFSDDATTVNIPKSVQYIGGESFRIATGKAMTINMLGKPYIGRYVFNKYSSISYGGTCEELHNNSYVAYNFNLNEYVGGYIIEGEYDGEYYVKTTDTDTCKVYSSTSD